MPENEIVRSEFDALLVIVTLPAALPEAVGTNIAFIVVVAPGLRMSPLEMPLTLNPAPETVTFEMETLFVPVLATVRAWLLADPTETFPKVSAARFVLNIPEDVVSEFVGLELLLAPVSPEQPDWTMAANKIAANMTRAAIGGILRLSGRIGKFLT